MCYLPSLIKSLLTLHLTGRVAEVPGEGKSLVEAHKTSKKYNQKVNSGSGQPDPKVQPFPLEHIPSPGKHGASSSRNCLLEICPTLAGHGGMWSFVTVMCLSLGQLLQEGPFLQHLPQKPQSLGIPSRGSQSLPLVALTFFVSMMPLTKALSSEGSVFCHLVSLFSLWF